jgi:hypothetical protein
MVAITNPLEIEKMLNRLRVVEAMKIRKIKNLLYKTRPNYLLDEETPNQEVIGYERRAYLRR